MQMKYLLHFILPLLLALPLNGAWAQNNGAPADCTPLGYDLNHFQGLQAVGTLPPDFKKSLDDLYSEDRQRVRDYTDGKLPNADKVLQSSYYVNELMTSGRVIYGDPISCMVERVADTLLHDYPELRKELRFYTVKTPAVNAFATGQGIIFVNTGLVAQLQDEAQLAYILSHEIVHYLKKHNWEQITIQDKSNSRNVRKEVSSFLRMHNRSREMENQADSLGLLMFFMPSAYNTDVVNSVFDVLQYSYLPFDELPLDSTFFATQYYKLSGDYFLKKVDPITATDDYDDSKSTHPNLLKRRTLAEDIIAQNTHKGTKHYVVTTPEEFANLRTLARFECIRQCLIANDYPRALYDSYVLQKQLPNNLFLKKTLAQSLYALSRYQTERADDELVDNYKNYEGELQQAYYFLHKVKGDDLAILALRQVWKAHQADPTDTRLTSMASTLAVDLADHYHLSASSFADTYDTTSMVVDTTVSEQQNTKYARIKAKRRNQETRNSQRYGFTDLMLADNTMMPFLTKAHAADTSFDGTQGVMVCSPSYYCIDGKAKELRVKVSDTKRNTLASSLISMLHNNDMNPMEYSERRLQKMKTAEEYNEYVTLNDWCNEFMMSPNDYIRSFFTQDDIAPIMKKYGANVMNISIVVTQNKIPRDNATFSMFYFFILVPIVPIEIYDMCIGSHITIVNSYFVDVTNGRILSKEVESVDMRDSKALVNSLLYDNIYKLNHVTE
jgi:hypothetical protein